MTANPTGPLSGIRVLDLTRILAGPSCTQMLGDLGADVIKIERPESGDDTRSWGPPYMQGADGQDTAESAYYLCVNRNKRSVAVDISTPEGAVLVRKLAAQCDVVVENFKVGGLAAYGLSYEQLAPDMPGLVYCSITGFGQTGPYAQRAGYDAAIQAMGGLMSITGRPDAEGGEPTKVGVAVADLFCGLYASVGILAALRHRDQTGEGQHIDLALFDVQVATLANVASNYLISGKVPGRYGNGHPSIVPYQTFAAADGYIMLAVGNDGQFRRFCQVAGIPDVADDPRFIKNADRVRNRAVLVPLVAEVVLKRPVDDWVKELEVAGVPCSPVNTIDRVFADPQIQHRGMQIQVPHTDAVGGAVPLVGNPLRLSRTPVTYRTAPPKLGQDTDAVLAELFGENALP